MDSSDEKWVARKVASTAASTASSMVVYLEQKKAEHSAAQKVYKAAVQLAGSKVPGMVVWMVVR